MPKRPRAEAEDPAKKSKPEPKVGKAAAAAAGGGGGGNNAAIMKMFEDLMFYESKDGNKWASVAYNKVLATIRTLKKEITSGADVKNLAGIGEASVKKIDEFLTTGKIKKLEELKELYGALPDMLGGAKVVSGKSAAKAKADAASSKPTKDQLKKIAAEAKSYEAMSLDALKGLCRQNDQVISGTKAELVERCSQGKVLGAIPRCPLCGGGKPRFDIKTGLYKCPGYQDDEKWAPCIFQASALARVPWKET